MGSYVGGLDPSASVGWSGYVLRNRKWSMAHCIVDVAFQSETLFCKRERRKQLQ